MNTTTRDLRRRARRLAPQVLAACMLGYFLVHMLQGERGVMTYLRLQKDIEAAEDIRAQVAAQRGELENRVNRLQPESVDPDLLEEQARRVLNFARPDEIVILRESDEDLDAALAPEAGGTGIN